MAIVHQAHQRRHNLYFASYHALVTSIVGYIYLITTIIAIGMYVWRWHKSRSSHYLILCAASLIGLISSILVVSIAIPLSLVTILALLVCVLLTVRLTKLWVHSMHKYIPSSHSNISVRFLNVLYIVSPLLYLIMFALTVTALSGLRVLLGSLITLVLITVTNLTLLFYCVWLWHTCDMSAVEEMKVKKKQLLRLIIFSGLQTGMAIATSLNIDVAIIIITWIWIGLTLFPQDMLLHYQASPGNVAMGCPLNTTETVRHSAESEIPSQTTRVTNDNTNITSMDTNHETLAIVPQPLASGTA
ncbi:hypothetical protein BDF19DRAFT_303988 [Syncephalis fuscata]|nr:hypothetical protein BDF19DRAFT_303988 [Syncephalis fuscata]